MVTKPAGKLELKHAGVDIYYETTTETKYFTKLGTPVSYEKSAECNFERNMTKFQQCDVPIKQGSTWLGKFHEKRRAPSIFSRFDQTDGEEDIRCIWLDSCKLTCSRIIILHATGDWLSQTFDFL